jgi:hypothetical protein
MMSLIIILRRVNMEGLPSFPRLFDQIDKYFVKDRKEASKQEFDDAKEAYITIRKIIYSGGNPPCPDHPRGIGGF